jgi:acetylornithine deacetylase/succinyl-diaminopimelate desuccinylase-like protein
VIRIDDQTLGRLRAAVRRDRLLDTAVRLVSVPSWTGQAGAAADGLADILSADGFAVERPEAGHAAAPAVVVRLDGAAPGRTLQLDGHIDTVHLPFVPPAVRGDRLTGSGAFDMKGGVAAAVEAVRALRETGAPAAGRVLLTAHDLHEAPWGLGEQLDRMILDGVAGDGALVCEPFTTHVPVVGRGAATWKVAFRRPGPPVHEVVRPADEPSVVAAGAELVARLGKLAGELQRQGDPGAGPASVFIGQIHSGEIYNQYPQECWLEGTRRWLPGTDRAAVEADFRGLIDRVARETRTSALLEYRNIRDAFRLDEADPLLAAFQAAHAAAHGAPLPTGPKPFVDDGNSFYGLRRIPAITHGGLGGGAHTLEEWVSVDSLAAAALTYALTAVLYCRGPAADTLPA